MSADDVALVAFAGRVHDVGMLAIPEEIREKPEPLDEAERRMLARHPIVGSHMLVSLGLGRIAEWVRHHHERWDGNGYPDGLRGEEIPLASRIIAVAEAYDAMTAARPYDTPRRTHAEALAELGRCAGHEFEPHIVAACVDELSL